MLNILHLYNYMGKEKKTSTHQNDWKFQYNANGNFQIALEKHHVVKT